MEDDCGIDIPRYIYLNESHSRMVEYYFIALLITGKTKSYYKIHKIINIL